MSEVLQFLFKDNEFDESDTIKHYSQDRLSLLMVYSKINTL